MGREIRRVPPNWEHPRHTEDTAMTPERVGSYRPCYDETYEDARKEWLAGLAAWEAGTHKDCKEHKRRDDGTTLDFWEWHGAPPDRDTYRPAFTEPATWYQVYETVSEGTPVTPPFATEDEMIDYLVAHGTFWDQKDWRGTPKPEPHGYARAVAERFVRGGGSVPSLMIVDGQAYSGIECAALGKPEEHDE